MLSTDLLVTYRVSGKHRDRAGIRREDGTVTRPDLLEPFDGLMSVLESWSEVADELRRWDGRGEIVEDARVLAPLRYPRKLLFAGANYHDHLREMGTEDVREGWEPWFFQKPPSTTVIGPGETILIPSDPSAKVDWEAELGVVIGQVCREVSPEQAPDFLAGYTAINDVSARGLHRRSVSLAGPFDFDWLASKGRDTFCPMGPGIVPAWSIADPQDLRVRLWRNGELKQDQTTAEMIFDCWEQVAALSHVLTLEPGDVVATGTPGGVGATQGEFLAPGDEVSVEISGVGRLDNPVSTRR
jgi:2-keto-4-pentenoate hydratase/2-oxohepta-3-ene-1,7-dioic acid hydratase in catechol pathway